MMFGAAGIQTSSVTLSDEEHDMLDMFFVDLSLGVGAYRQTPGEEQDIYAELCRTWQLTKIALTRTVSKE